MYCKKVASRQLCKLFYFHLRCFILTSQLHVLQGTMHTQRPQLSRNKHSHKSNSGRARAAGTPPITALQLRLPGRAVAIETSCPQAAILIAMARTFFLFALSLTVLRLTSIQGFSFIRGVHPCGVYMGQVVITVDHPEPAAATPHSHVVILHDGNFVPLGQPFQVITVGVHTIRVILLLPRSYSAPPPQVLQLKYTIVDTTRRLTEWGLIPWVVPATPHLRAAAIEPLPPLLRRLPLTLTLSSPKHHMAASPFTLAVCVALYGAPFPHDFMVQLNVSGAYHSLPLSRGCGSMDIAVPAFHGPISVIASLGHLRAVGVTHVITLADMALPSTTLPPFLQLSATGKQQVLRLDASITIDSGASLTIPAGVQPRTTYGPQPRLQHSSDRKRTH
jgi:hypothetical protein